MGFFTDRACRVRVSTLTRGGNTGNTFSRLPSSGLQDSTINTMIVTVKRFTVVLVEIEWPRINRPLHCDFTILFTEP